MGQRLRLIDAPVVPTAPEAKMKTMIMSFATFLILGLMLTIGAVVVATVLNHTILSAADVQERLGIRLLAVVPEGGGGTMRIAKAPKMKTAKAPKDKAAAKPAKRSDAGSAQVKQLPAARRSRPAAGAPTGARPKSGAGRPSGRATGTGTGGWPG
jgi:hypothetical protein